jgi:hypothetical protein
MMFLFSGIRAEVEPVPGKQGWYQLTGKHIERWTVDVSDTFGDLRAGKVKVKHNAKIRGIHNVDPEIELRDPRFNHENNDGEGNILRRLHRGWSHIHAAGGQSGRVRALPLPLPA